MSDSWLSPTDERLAARKAEIATREAEVLAEQGPPVVEIEVNPAIEERREAAHGRRWDLEQRRRTLSLDAISDPAAAGELEQVESDLNKIDVELERLGLAAAEHERREIARLDEDEYQRRRAALVEASALSTARLKAAQKVDKGAAMYFAGVAEYAAVCQDMARLLRDGGADAGAQYAGAHSYMIVAALAQARHDRHDELRGIDFDRLGYVPVHQSQPLAEAEAQIRASIGAGVYVEYIDAERAATKSDAEAT